MLGCHEFCGYYDWTFHYVSQVLGRPALPFLLRDALGDDAKDYLEVGAAKGLRGLYESWIKTGEEEQCDWTFTLDEEKNVLRWDMRECPSKGFLVHNDLHAAEDYCNHCMGWVIPMLERLGGEIVGHEHNHCGQCWATMRMKDRPSQPLQLDIDIRNDPRWKRGFLDRWADDQQLPICPEVCPTSDPCELLELWFHRVDAVIIQKSDATANQRAVATPSPTATLVSDAMYNDRQQCPTEPAAVLIGCPPVDLALTAARYNRAAAADRPLLMHAFLPGVPFVDFVSSGLPRPVPILPLLIRKGLYLHRPNGPYATSNEFLAMLAKALDKKIVSS